MESFDAIVVGLGVMGGATLLSLSRRGLRVLGLEQFTPVHDRGSSHGQSRIIRKAYFEHPDYVPLLEESYRLWGELEHETGRRLFDRCGLLLLGREDGAVIRGVRRARDAHALNIRELPHADLAPRFPAITPPETMVGMHEPDAGLLRAEDCVRAQIELAVRRGAKTYFEEPLTSWSIESGAVLCKTTRTEYLASRLVICGGAWSSQVLRDLGLPLEIRRKVQMWFGSKKQEYTSGGGFPVFGVDTGDAFFYGFPANERGEMKIAEHLGREMVEHPERVKRELQPTDASAVQGFIRRFLPGVGTEVLRHSVCLYTMTRDEHFILDRHPEHPNVCFAAGFSGHGFKFAPLVGEVMADLAVDGATNRPIEFLRWSRFAGR